MRSVPAIIVWSALCLSLWGCGGGSSPTSPSSSGSSGSSGSNTTKDETAPVLSVAFVQAEQAVAFFIFGATLPSGVQNPTYEIETPDQTAAVVAASGGKVVAITISSNGIDRSITIVPSDASVWSIIYDHVSNVRVSVGQTVAAGAQLGTMGVLNNGRGRTELQVNRFDPAPTLSYCPQTFGTTTFNAAFAAAAQRLNGSATVCSATTVKP
jgi:hypothetical protein